MHIHTKNIEVNYLFHMAQACFNHFSFLQTIFFVYVLRILTCNGSLLSHDEECLALYMFKQNIRHQDYASFHARKFDSWKITSNESVDCCLWDGVACNNYEEDKGRVIGLDLSGSFLRGPINSNNTLFNLVHLRMLNLAMNDFSESTIPSTIARLTQLRSLNLSGSRFSGQIPNEVGELIQLSSLDLSWNPLKLESLNLQNLVQNLSRLEELNLSGVDISSSVPSFLANFSSLRSIRLNNCGLRDEFPMAILHLPKLKFLDVSYNTNLTGSFPEFRNNSLLEELFLASTGFYGIVPESISNLNHLRYMDLTQCFFSGRIPNSLSNLTQLIVLAIAQNEFTSQVPSLASLSELKVLELGGNKFEKRRLPDWVGKLTKLRELYLNEMNLYGEIPPFIANLTKLTSIKIETNSLSGHIPSLIFNLTQLRVLHLGKNQLQGPISNSFSKFKSLHDLRLHKNDFGGKVDLDTFIGLRKLKVLYVGENRISFVTTNNYTNDTLPQLEKLDMSSCNLKEFPAFLRFQYRMKGLILENNKIDGLVPVWFLNNNHKTLQVLGLSNNFITGFHKHSHLLPWVRLKVLTIDYNQLRGTLPIPPQTIVIYIVANNNLRGQISPVICELKSIQLLDLSSNNMNGTLPSCLGRLSNSLLVLDLKRNNFQGTMMDICTHGGPLKRIDLSENQFVGQVSRTLTNCTSLEVLSLGDNFFDDVFPSWLRTLAELQVLILRSNKFHGAIQVEKNVSLQFPKLRIIDLSNNGFSGQLPDEYFQAWNEMKSVYAGKSSVVAVLKSDLLIATFPMTFPYLMTITNKGVKTEYQKILNIFTAIDLSCNNFEGQIPESLQDLQGLESLNLSNNHLTGRILPSLGNLVNLESLDLSQNELSGEIPHQLVQLGYLAIMNVSFNHLDGRIPQGKQFDTFENNSYKGNQGLCGKPLFKDCENSKASTPPPTINISESLLPSESVDWIVIFSGVGSGLVIGIIIGNIVYAKYSDWLIELFGMRNDRWIRSPGNRRRNQVLS